MCREPECLKIHPRHAVVLCPKVCSSGYIFVSTPADKDADPVTQVAIAVPTPVAGNAPLDPAYVKE